MESVERALAIRRTTSRDQFCQDGDGSTLHELIADPQNNNNLNQLDWDLGAEAIDNALPADDERTDWFRRSICRARPSKHWPTPLMFAAKDCANS